MILTLDVGNSNIHTVVYSEYRDMIYQDRTETLREIDEEFYIQFFRNLKYKLKNEVKQIMISCVVPKITQTLVETSKQVFNCPVHAINTQNTDLKIHLDKPEELGADFIASAYGAMYQYKTPVVVIDMGTASKISVISHHGHFLGGVIQPGIGQMAKILHENIPHLPSIELKVPEKIIGNSTIESIQSGITHGALLSLLAMAKEIEKELNEPCKFILTGGYINLYKEKYGITYNPNLINEGLYFLAKEKFNEK